jgi:4-hydroxy-tetrahydrodipicolinate reductase
VLYAGPHERVELTHRAHSRAVFAAGALRAALWLYAQKPGFYDYFDLLGLEQL